MEVENSHKGDLTSGDIMSNHPLQRKGNTVNEISFEGIVVNSIILWKYLKNLWWILLLSGFIGGLLGLTYAMFKKPIYKAQLSFALEDEKSGGGFGGALGIASQFGFDIGGGGGGAFSGDNLLSLMKSRSMVRMALLTPVIINNKTTTLAEFYIDFNDLHRQWQKSPNLKSVKFLPGANPDNFTRAQDSLLGEFHKNLINKSLTVDKIDKKLSIIAINVSSENELFSKYFAEILAKRVSDFYIETKTKKSVQNVGILQRQTDSIRSVLNGAISGVASLVDANPNINPSRLVLRAPSQKRQVDVQANTAILTELVKNLEISKVSLRKETPLIQIIDKPILPLEKERLGKIKGFIIGSLLVLFITTLVLSVKRFSKIE